LVGSITVAELGEGTIKSAVKVQLGHWIKAINGNWIAVNKAAEGVAKV
jgi:hypothetical protein